MAPSRQPQVPPPAVNLSRAIQRDYLHDPSTGPFLRAFALGYGVSVGPEIIKALIGLALLKRSDRFSLTFRKLRNAIFDGLSTRSFALFLSIAFGGAKWLERFSLDVVQRWRERQAKAAKTSEERRIEKRTTRAWSTFAASSVSSFVALLIYQSSNRLKERASVISPVPEMMHQILRKPRKNSPTLDLTLFSLVRAVDTIGRGLYWQYPQREGSFMGLLGEHADVLVFWLSCWRIMWCWFYLPARLPSSYVRWITNLARMDTRLLQLLRQARKGDFHYGKTPTEEVRANAMGIADHMGIPHQQCLPDATNALSCYAVHGSWVNSHSCEVNTAKRWATAWVQSMGIYLPVHAIPRLAFGRQKLMSQPVDVTLAALKAAARSSAFLATFVASIWGAVCLARTRLGPRLLPNVPQQFWDGGMAPMLGCMACGLSVLIENKRRRGEMALYVAPRALYAVLDEILPAWLFAGTTGKVVAKWSERAILSVSMGVITTAAAHEHQLVRGVAGSVVSYIVGSRWRAENQLKKY